MSTSAQVYSAEYMATVNVDHWLHQPGDDGSRTRFQYVSANDLECISILGLYERPEIAKQLYVKTETIDQYVLRTAHKIYGPAESQPYWLRRSVNQPGVGTRLWLSYMLEVGASSSDSPDFSTHIPQDAFDSLTVSQDTIAAAPSKVQYQAAFLRSLGISQEHASALLSKSPGNHPSQNALRLNAYEFRKRLGLTGMYDRCEVAWLLLNGGLRLVHGGADMPSLNFEGREVYFANPKAIRRIMEKRGIDPEAQST